MASNGNSSPPEGRPSGPMFAENLAPGVIVAETYEITRLIGRGGMGAVWEAKHLRLPGRFVAIKVLLGGSGSPEILVRFRREAEIASRLGHPNIVDAVDFNSLPDGTPYQVLERLTGENLAERLLRGPIALAETMALVRQMASGLAAAHREGIVHRDLKPENIFLCPAPDDSEIPRIKILDFGISKIRGAQTFKTQEAVVMGTPQYMSPEQAAGNNEAVDQRTDVFALAAIVYEMLSGQRAFSGDNVLTVMVQVMQGEPVPLAKVMPSLPASVVAAVESAMIKDLNKRCPNVDSFIQALTGRPLDTRGTQPPASPKPSHEQDAFAATMPLPALSAAVVNKRTGPAVLLGMVVAVSLTAGAFFFLKSSVQKPPPVNNKQIAAGKVTPTFDIPVKVDVVDAAPAAAVPIEAPAKTNKPQATPSASPLVNLPPDVVIELKEAEQLFASGRFKEAQRKAEHSLLGAISSRANNLLTRISCAQGDLTNANAYFQKVSRAERKVVLAACTKNGVDLQ